MRRWHEDKQIAISRMSTARSENYIYKHQKELRYEGLLDEVPTYRRCLQKLDQLGWFRKSHVHRYTDRDWDQYGREIKFRAQLIGFKEQLEEFYTPPELPNPEDDFWYDWEEDEYRKDVELMMERDWEDDWMGYQENKRDLEDDYYYSRVMDEMYEGY